MEALRIKQLKTRYRLPVSPGGASVSEMRSRLDGLLRVVMDEALEAALDYEGIGSHEEVCIRQVHAPVRLRLAESDQALIDQWSQVLAHYICRAINEGSGEMVVRYPARITSFVDFATGVALGCLNRAWAWNQLGIADLPGGAEGTSQSAAREQLMIAFEREPHFIVPVLKQLISRGHFYALARKLDASDWQVLAQTAQHAAGSSWRADGALEQLIIESAATGRLTRIPLHNSDDEVDVDTNIDTTIDSSLTHVKNRLLEKATVPAVLQLARALLTNSSIGQQLLSAPQLYRTAPAALEQQLILLVLEVEPTLMRQSSERIEALLAALAMLVVGKGNVDQAVLRKRQNPSVSDSVTKQADTQKQRELQTQDDSLPIHEGDEQRHTEQRLMEDEELVDDYPLPTPTTQIETEFGGLLYLLSLVDALELPDAIVAATCFEQRSFQWVLYHLALNLLPLNEFDPALLAFCGLGGEEELPWRDQSERELSDSEQQWFDEAAESLVHLLRERLAQQPDQPQQSRELLLDKVCRRQAQIMSEPGWLEVIFPLDAVSTEIRRAAIDLDPGYLPWLGQVVKFRYE